MLTYPFIRRRTSTAVRTNATQWLARAGERGRIEDNPFIDVRAYAESVGEGNADIDTAAMKAVVADHANTIESGFGGRPGVSVLVPGHLKLNETISVFRAAVRFVGFGITHGPEDVEYRVNEGARGSSFRWFGEEGRAMFDFDDCRWHGFENLSIIGNDYSRPIGILNDLRNPGHGGNAYFTIRDCSIGRTAWQMIDANGRNNRGMMSTAILMRSGNYGNVDFYCLENLDINGVDRAIDLQHTQHIYGSIRKVHVAQARVALRTNSQLTDCEMLLSDVDIAFEIGSKLVPVHPDDTDGRKAITIGRAQPTLHLTSLRAERVGALARMFGRSRLIIDGGHVQMPAALLDVGSPWEPEHAYAIGEMVQHRDPNLNGGENEQGEPWIWTVVQSHVSGKQFDRTKYERRQRLSEKIGNKRRNAIAPSRAHDRTPPNGQPFYGCCWIDAGQAESGALIALTNMQLAWPGGDFDHKVPGGVYPKILVRAGHLSAFRDPVPARVVLRSCTGVTSELFEDGLEYPSDRRLYEVDLPDGRQMRNYLNGAGLGEKLQGNAGHVMEYLDEDRYDMGASVTISYSVDKVSGLVTNIR